MRFSLSQRERAGVRENVTHRPSCDCNVNICDIGSGVLNVRHAVDQYVEGQVEEHQIQAVDFLRESVYIRDNHLVLSNNVSFTNEELESLINYTCMF